MSFGDWKGEPARKRYEITVFRLRAFHFVPPGCLEEKVGILITRGSADLFYNPLLERNSEIKQNGEDFSYIIFQFTSRVFFSVLICNIRVIFPAK